MNLKKMHLSKTDDRQRIGNEYFTLTILLLYICFVNCSRQDILKTLRRTAATPECLHESLLTSVPGKPTGALN